MENTEEMVTMLNQIPSPAFFAKDGIITHANTAAQQRQIHIGSHIESMLVTGLEEYAQFQDGSLYLTIRVCDIPSSVCVTKMEDIDLFVLEQDADQAELQSMALAAQALRGPLSNVMTVTDRLFPLSCFDDAPEAQDQIARINRGLYQMLRIVCNMSDAYRYSIDNNLRTEVREIGGLVEELFMQSMQLIDRTGVAIQYSGPSESIYGLVDANKLERAIGNILSNALKFSRKGGSIYARLTRKGKMLYLTVQDDGPGVPVDLKAGLYRRYQRQPGLEDGRFGIGLGMVLVRQIAAAHGGTVLMEHGTDFGLRLTMTIPIRQPSDPNVRSPMIHVDYAGDRDHLLLELADCLPPELYTREKVN